MVLLITNFAVVMAAVGVLKFPRYLIWSPPLDRYEYIRLSIKNFSQNIIDAYNLLGIVHNGYVYCEIQRGMHGLPQVGKLAYN